MRKSPTYFVIENSRRSSSVELARIRKGIDLYIHEQLQNPWALEVEWISILASGEPAQVLLPLTELMELQNGLPNPLYTNQRTNEARLSDVVKLVGDRFRSEVAFRTEEAKGDFSPLVIFVFQGRPDDEQSCVENLDELTNCRPWPILSCVVPGGEVSETSKFRDKFRCFCEVPSHVAGSLGEVFRSLAHHRDVYEESVGI
jgi:uncharacterized protein YegL